MNIDEARETQDARFMRELEREVLYAEMLDEVRQRMWYDFVANVHGTDANGVEYVCKSHVTGDKYVLRRDPLMMIGVLLQDERAMKAWTEMICAPLGDNFVNALAQAYCDDNCEKVAMALVEKAQ